MRWPRMGIVVGVIGLLLLGAGWWLAGVGSGRPREHLLAGAATPQPPAGLLRALQLYLASSSRPVVPAAPPRPVPRQLQQRLAQARAPRDLQPNGTACPAAAGGSCSLRPCVVYAGSASAVVLQAAPVPSLSPARSGCQGRPAPPRTLLVGGA